jgi:hypothetical protein
MQVFHAPRMYIILEYQIGLSFWFNYFLQLINIGSQYNYGNEDHAEFLCVVSREYGPRNANKEREAEPTDRAKVRNSLF